jgi:hypothetical protein
MAMSAYLNCNDNLNLIKNDNVCIIEVRYECFSRFIFVLLDMNS